MSKSPKSQFYRYSLKVGGLINAAMCTDKAWLYLLPPEDAQSIENLYCHIKITFDSSVVLPSQKLVAVGISDVPLTRFNAPVYEKEIELNLQADPVTRVIETTVDLTTLLKKDNVRFDNVFGDFSINEYTMVYIRLADALQDILVVGTINVWKLEALFTTKEIR